MLQVVRANNKSLEGMSGQVTDETRNTLMLTTEKGKKTLIKDQIMIRINNRTIDGKKLTGRIEERLKNQ